MSDRAAALKAVRDLVDSLEAHPEVPLPNDWNLDTQDYGGVDIAVGFEFWDAEDKSALVRERFAQVIRALPVTRWEKSTFDGESGGGSFWMRGYTDGGLRISVYAERDAVCERKVIGTETVEVPDPNAPTVTVEREIVEWQCHPVLA